MSVGIYLYPQNCNTDLSMTSLINKNIKHDFARACSNQLTKKLSLASTDIEHSNNTVQYTANSLPDGITTLCHQIDYDCSAVQIS